MSQLDRIEAKLDEILSLLAEAPARLPDPAQQGSRARAVTLAAHDKKWDAVKARLPKFVVHPKSCAAYEEHCKTYDGEPNVGRIEKWARQLAGDRQWTRAQLEDFFQISREKAQAMISFLKWSGLAVWRSKGICVDKTKIQL